MASGKSEWLNLKGLTLGATALGLLPFVDGVMPFRGMPGVALAQGFKESDEAGPNRQRLLDVERHVHKAGFPELEKKQAKEYKELGDPRIIFKGEESESFYEITREEVRKLPGEHPNPDVYKDFTFEKNGTTYSCCSGADC